MSQQLLTDDRRSGEELRNALVPLFGEDPTFVTDDEQLQRWLEAQGCRTADPNGSRDMLARLTSVVMLPTRTLDTLPSQADAWHTRARVLVYPLISFDPSYTTAVYDLQLLGKCDFKQASAQNRHFLELLMKTQGPLRASNAGTELECNLDASLQVMAPRVALKPGELDSLGAFFEVGMVPKGAELGYHASGTLSVPGVSVAHRRSMHGDALWGEVWDYMGTRRAEGRFPLEVVLDNSSVVTVRAGDNDITADIRRFTKDSKLQLVELSFGTNMSIDPALVDWNINSQIHEGMSGIHAGVGDGESGVHIDFICPGVDFH